MIASVVSRSEMKISRMTNDNREKFFVSLVAWCEKKRWTSHRDKGVRHRYHLKIHHYPLPHGKSVVVGEGVQGVAALVPTLQRGNAVLSTPADSTPLC